MEEIKKVNSLEELNALQVGDTINAYEFMANVDLKYEGEIGGKVALIETRLDEEDNLWSRRYSKQDIKFYEGKLMLTHFENEQYAPNDPFYKEKLNLINGVITK